MFRRTLAAAAAAIVLLAMLSVVVSRPPTPERATTTGTDGFRTWDWLNWPDGVLEACTLLPWPDPDQDPPNVVSGELNGDPAERDPVWIASGERRLSVVWPAHYSVRWRPEAMLVIGNAFGANAGDRVQFGILAGSGTYDDPYLADPCRWRVLSRG